jgi:hypothetical protein
LRQVFRDPGVVLREVVEIKHLAHEDLVIAALVGA